MSTRHTCFEYLYCRPGARLRGLPIAEWRCWCFGGAINLVRARVESVSVTSVPTAHTAQSTTIASDHFDSIVIMHAYFFASTKAPDTETSAISLVKLSTKKMLVSLDDGDHEGESVATHLWLS